MSKESEVVDYISGELLHTPEAVLINDTSGTIGNIPEGLYRVTTWSSGIDFYKFPPGEEPNGWDSLLNRWKSKKDMFYFVTNNEGERWVLMVDDKGYSPLMIQPDIELIETIAHDIYSIYDEW